MKYLKFLSFAFFFGESGKLIITGVDAPSIALLVTLGLFSIVLACVRESAPVPEIEAVILKKLKEAEDNARKAILEVERQRDEQAKIHALAEETQKLLSQVNLGLGFRPFKKREQA